MNSNPALFVHSAAQRAVLPALVADSLDCALLLRDRPNGAPPLPATELPAVRAGRFAVLCDEGRGAAEMFPPLV